MLIEDLQNCVLASIEVSTVVPELLGPQLGADMRLNTGSQHLALHELAPAQCPICLLT